MPVIHAKIRAAEEGSIFGEAPRASYRRADTKRPITVPEPKRKRRRLDLPLQDSGTLGRPCPYVAKTSTVRMAADRSS